MRLAALLAIVLILAPAASAASLPPIGFGGLSGIRIVKLKPMKQPKSCSAQRSTRRAADKVARRIHPVACEQPPRSKALDAGFAILIAP
jgi:hypothetical protein